jgi:hypothetical protein
MALSCLLFLLAGVAAVPVPLPLLVAPPEGAARPLAEVVEAARKARASGDWDNARRLCQEALRQDPEAASSRWSSAKRASTPAIPRRPSRSSRLTAAAPDHPAPRRARAGAAGAGKAEPALEQARGGDARSEKRGRDGPVRLRPRRRAQAEDAVAVFRGAL